MQRVQVLNVLTRKSDRALWVCVALLCAMQCWALHDVRFDDAYVTFRYAENLARGVGPVFNPGERVLGTTAPGHMLLGALLYTFVGKAALPSAMAVVGCVGWGAQALALFALMKSAFSLVPSAFSCLLLLLGATFAARFVPLETHLVSACLLWAMVFAIRRAWLGAAVLCALAGLLRPDAYIVALLIGSLALYEARRELLLPIAAFTLITLAWQIPALLYYGSPLPQPVATKYARTPTLDYLGHELWQSVAPLFPGAASISICVILWACVITGACTLLSRNARLWILPAYGIAHFVAYAWLRPFKDHIWHLYPLNLVAFTLVAAAWAYLYERLARERIVLLAAALLLSFFYAERSIAFARTHDTQYWYGARHAVYLEVAAFLKRHARQDEVVAVVEVGTLGYYSELPMYDTGGLISKGPRTKPDVTWLLIDKSYAFLAGGMPSVRTWDVHGFNVSLYNYDWVRRALAAAARRLPGVSPAQLIARHRSLVQREFNAVVQAHR